MYVYILKYFASIKLIYNIIYYNYILYYYINIILYNNMERYAY